MSKLKCVLKASGHIAACLVIYYACEGMTAAVLLVALNVLATEKINISELLKCFTIPTSRE